MKFGKRLAAEAARSSCAASFVDYRQLKAAIKRDVAARDARGPLFEAALRAELHKVAAFYLEKEEELGAAMARLSHGSSPQEVALLRSELQELRKYAALNHYAVVKACKKRNRHLRAACGEGAVAPVRAVGILSQQHFFTSQRLAALTAQAEVLAQELAPRPPPPGELLQRYQCPICLDLLRAPVLLTCAHRFCWGCLLAHAASARRGAPPGKADGKPAEAQRPPAGAAVLETQQAQQQARQAGEDDELTCSTFDCAVCRKAQLLDLERLQVDPHLDAFLQKLQRAQRAGGSAVLPLAPPGGAAPAGSAPLAIARPGAAAAAAAAEADDMLVDAKPPSGTTSLAEASELAEAAAQHAAAQQHAAQQQAAPPPAAAPAPAPVAAAPAAAELPLLPPQHPSYASRLVVCLDLDGTLVTTFTPKRAPKLPHGSISYIVGRGGRLNPAGVFVVERPGLGEFLRRLGQFAEVVLFTAGLEDYAAPICDMIERRYPRAFHHRLYRPATVAEDVYPCIKDMSRLGRDLGRCVLVDDTPLAFFRQPDHGVPVLQFRGDMDDRMLPEAVAPLLESLAGCADVAAPLSRRFNMHKWFAAQGLAPPGAAGLHRHASLPQLRVPTPGAAAGAAPAAPAAVDAAFSGTLLVCDFDRTLVDYDAGERLCDELAPELTSLLSAMQMPANFVPVTNTVLSEMQRRGVSRDRLVDCLREMGREVPAGSRRMLEWAASRGLETAILSDCNSVFIAHILAGARVNSLVRHVITNKAGFRRVPAPAPEAPPAPAVPPPEARPPRVPSGFASTWLAPFRSSAGAGSSSSSDDDGSVCGAPAAKAPPPSVHRLVIEPRHDAAAHGPHGCPRCPANLCKGAELAALRATLPRAQRVIYCGDGANDLCPALELGPADVVLARAGYDLARLLAEAGSQRPRAAVHLWRSHDELCRLVQQFAV